MFHCRYIFIHVAAHNVSSPAATSHDALEGIVDLVVHSRRCVQDTVSINQLKSRWIAFLPTLIKNNTQAMNYYKNTVPGSFFAPKMVSVNDVVCL